jgi:ABC-type amino acid transport substrate-binding protein
MWNYINILRQKIVATLNVFLHYLKTSGTARAYAQINKILKHYFIIIIAITLLII